MSIKTSWTNWSIKMAALNDEQCREWNIVDSLQSAKPEQKPDEFNFLSFKDVQYSKIANTARNRWQIVLRNKTDSMHLGTPMEIDFSSAYLHYPLPQCSKIVTSIFFSTSYELFRLPSAKVPQDYHLLRTFVWKSWPGTMGHFLIRNTYKNGRLCLSECA